MKLSFLLKMIDKCHAIPIKIPEKYFIDIDKIILQFIWKGKGTRIAKTILGKNKVEGISLHDFNIYTIIVIKIVWYWWKDRPIDQWNRTENRIAFPTNGPGTWTFIGRKKEKKERKKERKEKKKKERKKERTKERKEGRKERKREKEKERKKERKEGRKKEKEERGREGRKERKREKERKKEKRKREGGKEEGRE